MFRVYLVGALLLSVAFGAGQQNRAEDGEEEDSDGVTEAVTEAQTDAATDGETDAATDGVSDAGTGTDVSEGSESTVASSDASEDSETGSSGVSGGSESTASSDGVCMCECPCGGVTEEPKEEPDEDNNWVAPVIPQDEGLCLESDVVFNICAKNTEIGMKFKEAQQKCSSAMAKSGSAEESGSKSNGSKESKESGSKSKGSKESKESGSKSKGSKESKESKESGSKSKGSKESKESGSKSKGSKESKESGSKSKGSKESKESGSKSKGSSSSSSSESEEGCDDEFDEILELFEAAWEMKSCVFKEMGWVNSKMEVNLDAIQEDLNTLPDFIKNGMEDTIDVCSAKAENATIENIFGNEDFDLKLSKEVKTRSGSAETGSQSEESGSKSKGSKESKESGSKSKGSKESKESGSKSKGSKESKESGSKSKGSKESKESGSKSKGSKESSESSSSESGASSSIEDCVPEWNEDQINKIEEIMQKLVFFQCIHDSFLDMCGKYIIGLIKKDVKPPTPPCITISGAQKGAPCTFPFITRGMEYYTCTYDGGYDTPWCATKTDEKGEIILGNWGECPKPDEDPNCYPFPAFPETTTAPPNDNNNGGCGCDFEFSSISLSINISFTIISGQNFNGFPCYLGSDGSFLYVSSEGYWVVGTKLGVSATITMKYTVSKATITIPNMSWMYFQSESWINTTDLFVLPQKNFDVSFNSSISSIHVSYSKTVTMYGGFPVYIGQDGSFMWVNAEGYWVCGTKLGDSNTVFMQNILEKATIIIPSMSWEYEVNGQWTVDPELISLPQSGFDVSFSSSTIHVSFSKTVTIQEGFPVYIGQDGSFMWVNTEGYWVCGTTLGDASTIFMQNIAAKATETLPSLDWQYREEGGEWIIDSGLVSIPQKGQDLEFQSSSLSIQVSFTKTTSVYNNFPVYIGSDGSFMYVSKENVWVVGTTLGNKYTTWMKSTEVATATIPTLSWTYHVYGSPWVAIPDLVSIPQKGFDVSFSSSTIHVSFSKTETMHGGFPVYIGQDGSFMWVNAEGYWVSGTTLGDTSTVYMQNIAAKATETLPSLEWQYKENGEWIVDSGLVSIPQKGFDVSFSSSTIHVSFSKTVTMHGGFPVYIGQDGSFMWVNAEGYWVSGTTLGDASTVYMQNIAAKATETLPSFDWQYKEEGGEWVVDSGLVSLPQKGFDVSFSSSTIHVSFSKTVKMQGNFPVYIGQDGSYMWVNAEGYWVCGTTLGDVSTVYMQNTATTATETLPSFDWQYKKEGGEWIVDSGLVSIPQKGFDVSFSSTTIHVSFSKTVTMREGFPVYIGQDGSFMWVNSEGYWVCGTTLGDASTTYMQNIAAKATETLPSLDWQYREEGGEWIIDSGLVSIPQKGQDLMFSSTSKSIHISYTKVTTIYNAYPIYIGSDGSFMWVSSEGIWVVGTTLGDESTCFMKNEATLSGVIPAMSWFYRSSGGQWEEISDLYSLPQKDFNFEFTSTGGAASVFTFPIGFKVLSIKEGNYPVYIGSDGSFMFAVEGTGWVIGPVIGEVSSIWMKTTTTELSFTASYSWTYKEGAEWKEDSTLSLTGEIPQGECITISGAQVGLPCTYPFIARGKTFTKPCTFEGGYSTPWCPTKLSSDGGIILGNWGECPTEAVNPSCTNDGTD